MTRCDGARGGWATVLVLAIWLSTVGAARGAVVQLRTGGGSPAESANLQFTGLPGESNRVTIARAGDGTLVVTDSGARLLPGENCGGGGAAVMCPVPVAGMALQITVAASDGDDQIVLEGPMSYAGSYLSGGSGADVIIGGPGQDWLLGDAGNDRLDGGEGDDELAGFAGADALRGGPGSDTATYREHRDAVSVTLDGRADDGAVGEGDDAGLDVENVTGGSGPNRLVGSDVANRLEGGDSVNELSGGGGADHLIASSARGGGVLTGGPGSDTVSPGTENLIDLRDGEVDRVQCDSGLARPPLADAADKLRQCVPQAEVRGPTAGVGAGGRVQLRFRCRAVAQRCHVRIELRWRRQVVSRASLAVGRRQTRVLIRLNRRGRRLIAQHPMLEVTGRLRVFRTAAPRSVGPPFEGLLTLRRR